MSPAGQSTILMTDSGSDLGTLPDNGQLLSGAYRPSVGAQTINCRAPGSFPDLVPTGPHGSSLSAFNGTWKRYVIDDLIGDDGSITGWSLDISLPDTRHPRVISTVPTSGASGVAPSANIKATFSEEMGDRSPIITFGHPNQHFAHPSRLLRIYGKDASHALAPPFSRHT